MKSNQTIQMGQAVDHEGTIYEAVHINGNANYFHDLTAAQAFSELFNRLIFNKPKYPPKAPF